MNENQPDRPGAPGQGPGDNEAARDVVHAVKPAFNDRYLRRDRVTGNPLTHHPYEIVRGDGTRVSGVTDALGYTSEQASDDDGETVMVRALRPGKHPA
ncbi:hypothetical protein [Burkholderia territorii]|uniref:hypothetical protein n=1 Tax=Burkholderia territorii TaxID=1503055 RepID=UPI0007587064|nr:hypothetical protein [Burkholderia territorii]KVG55858.1 hypothetical protein WS79_21145 [Burkholderia territorii]